MCLYHTSAQSSQFQLTDSRFSFFSAHLTLHYLVSFYVYVFVCFSTFFFGKNGMQAYCRCLALTFEQTHTHSHKLDSYIFQSAENGVRKFGNCRAKKKRKRRTNYKIDSPYFLPNVRKLVKSVSSTYSKVYSPNAQITSSSFFSCHFARRCSPHSVSVSVSMSLSPQFLQAKTKKNEKTARNRDSDTANDTPRGTGRSSDAMQSWWNVEIVKENERK